MIPDLFVIIGYKGFKDFRGPEEIAGVRAGTGKVVFVLGCTLGDHPGAIAGGWADVTEVNKLAERFER